MSLETTVLGFADLAKQKADRITTDPLAFAVSAMMAGAYIGFGILLIFSVGQTADPSVQSLIMGLSFGVALTLVVFAGSDLFTGHTMYFAIGLLTGRCQTTDLIRSWSATWSFNLLGSFALAVLFVIGGGGAVLQAGGHDLLHAIAYKKMSSPAYELVARAMLCNWLVCLALWGAARTDDDTAKCIIIFWCLFAFISAGFEHSVANMTIFSVALLSEHPEKVTLLGAAHNLIWVTLGNILSGAIIMGAGYWLVAGRPRVQQQDERSKSNELVAYTDS